MWKPGSSAPSAKQDEEVPSPKRLSSGTMGMRFMQRARPSEEPASAAATDAATPRAALPTPNTDYLIATPADLYGDLLTGRRSFGGFNSVIESAWQAHARGTSGPSDAELLARVSREKKKNKPRRSADKPSKKLKTVSAAQKSAKVTLDDVLGSR